MNAQIQRVRDLRREANALYGLLYFAGERRYPERVVAGLNEMLASRVAELARLDCDFDAVR